MFLFPLTALLKTPTSITILFYFMLTILFTAGTGRFNGVHAQPMAEAIPQRIVSLAPSLTETLFALDAGDRVVGVTTYSNYPPQALQIPRIGNFINPSLETIMAKQPDLIVAVKGGANREKILRLKRLGFRVVILPVNSLKDIFSSIRLLAGLVGRERSGEELLVKIQTQIKRVRKTIDRVRSRRVLMLVGLRPLVAAGGGTYINEILTLAGGKNIAAEAPTAWPHLPLDYVVSRAPEVIIEGGMGTESDDPGKYWADLRSIPAVQEGRIYPYYSDKILRPGPRVGEALEEIARLIHPECFAPLDGKKNRKENCGGP